VETPLPTIGRFGRHILIDKNLPTEQKYKKYFLENKSSQSIFIKKVDSKFLFKKFGFFPNLYIRDLTPYDQARYIMKNIYPNMGYRFFFQTLYILKKHNGLNFFRNCMMNADSLIFPHLACGNENINLFDRLTKFCLNWSTQNYKFYVKTVSSYYKKIKKLLIENPFYLYHYTNGKKNRLPAPEISGFNIIRESIEELMLLPTKETGNRLLGILGQRIALVT